MPDSYHETFAEMQREEKNKISMRKMAFEKLKKFLEE
jgi:inosine/xanthosine triphosphate pyrophosphatase family protein